MDRLSTGNRQLDSVLAGGFPCHSVNIVMGVPGTGKTLLSEQIAFANASVARPALYLTTVSEPLEKIVAYLQEMTFADVDRIGSEVLYEPLAEVLRERPEALVDRIAELIQQHRPAVVVVDSFKAIAELVAEPLRWRNLVFDLAALLGAYDATSFWVGEYAGDAVSRLPEFAVADGILELVRTQRGSRDDRYLKVVKLRGSDFRDGHHAFVIGKGGLTVYPRIVGPGVPSRYDEAEERLQTGILGLDAMVENGWLRGTSTLVVGPSGAGKTMVGLHFLRRGVDDGEPGLHVSFQENPNQLRRVMRSLGWETEEMLDPARLDVLYTSPVEVQIDSVIEDIFCRIDSNGVRRVVIDAMGDLEKAAPDPSRFADYVYALSQELAARGITSMLTVEASGPAADGWLATGRDISFMSDNILLLAMELDGDIRRTMRIVKTRGSAHDGKLHVLRISNVGMVVD